MSPFESSARSHPSFFAVRIVLIGLLTAAAAGLLLLARQSGAYAAPSCDKT